MSVTVTAKNAKVHWLSNDHCNGTLTATQGILYLIKGLCKLGKADAESYAGCTPAEAFERRYSGMKSAMTVDFEATDIFVYDKSVASGPAVDDGVRAFIVALFNKNRIPFSANVGVIQRQNTNSEALLDFDREQHLPLLVAAIKQYCGLAVTFDTKDPITWRWGQEHEVKEIVKRIKHSRLCLYAAYTSRGKTKIAIGVAVRLCQQGGIVLVTTPIADTKKSFKENIDNYCFGPDRTLKVTYMDSVEFAKHKVSTLRQRANNGELIFVVLTVQDLRYGEGNDTAVDDNTKKLRSKYHALSGAVDLWIRDERHAQYGGKVTSQRLAEMSADYELDLTATPYNVLDQYDWEQIVSRTLLWGLKHRAHTNLPVIRIDAMSTPLANVSPKIAALYSKEEGFDPRKLFVRSNNNFVLETELLSIRDSMYHSPVSKKKNPLSIANDIELSIVAKNCGLWVLPEGQNGDGAADYIPALADLLNVNSKTFFIDSYTVERDCPKNTTIGDYVDSLVEQHGRVIILTCGKFLTGTDIPRLGHIVLMSKMNDIADFEQLIGRMIRDYFGKTEVKMYCFAPGMEIGLVLGKMARVNTELGGGSEYEILETIPLTEYHTDGPRKISPDAILAVVQAYFKQLSKDRLPAASLETALTNADLSAWEGLNTKKFKTAPPKTGVTDDNGAKVKVKVGGIDPKTGKPRVKEELTTITQIANAIQTVMVEAKWVAYSINNYDCDTVLSNLVLAKMFPEEIAAVNATINGDQQLKNIVIKNLNDKKLAYKGLAPADVYDDIFMNNRFKQSIGLVYVDFDLAKKLVNQLPARKYNKDGAVILVFNALNGTIPLLLRERFPKARIVCAEYFEYFKDHLARLGFEVTSVIYNNKEGTLYLENKMKFDVIIGNPPYQAPKKGDYSFWARFVSLADSLVTTNGHIVMVIPTGWMSPTNDIRQGQRSVLRDIFAKNNTSYINLDSALGKKHFPGVGQSFSWFVMQKAAPGPRTILDFGKETLVVNLSEVHFLAREPDEVNTRIISKLTSKSPKWEFSRFIMSEPWDTVSFSATDQYQNARINGNSNHLDKVCYTKNSCKTQELPKVVLPYNGTNYRFVVDPGKAGCTNAYVYILASTDLIESAAVYFDSKLIKWLGKNKFTQYNEGALINSVGKMDLSTSLTEQDIYEFYGISDDEIAYIEANVE